jgi:hypothetical protein
MDPTDNNNIPIANEIQNEIPVIVNTKLFTNETMVQVDAIEIIPESTIVLEPTENRPVEISSRKTCREITCRCAICTSMLLVLCVCPFYYY